MTEGGPNLPERTPAGEAPKKAHRMGKQQALALKVAAEQMFVFSPDGLTPKTMAGMPEFSGVGEATISAWVRDGGWVQKRRNTFRRLRDKVETHLGERMIKQAREQLALYDQIHAQFAAFILPNADGHLAAQPKSAESAVMALLKIDEARARMRREIRDMIGASVENQPQGGPAPTIHVDLSAEESRRMAHVLLQAELASAQAAKPPEPGDVGQ